MMMLHDHLERFAALGLRLHGVSLDFRRGGTGWPAPWRARCVATKNERSHLRLTRFGYTAEAAIDALERAVRQ